MSEQKNNKKEDEIMESKKVIYVLRKDLRLQNNKILTRIIEDGFHPVLLYVWNEKHLEKEQRGNSFRVFLKSILQNLEKEAAEKGWEFHLIEGTLAEAGRKVIEDIRPEVLYMQKQYLPWEIIEEEQLQKNNAMEIRIITDNFLLTEPGEVEKNDGTYYQVFTPYYNKWLAQREQKNESIEKPEPYNNSNVEKKINEFFKNKLKNYSIDRDYPDLRGTSELSAYINTGVISVEKLVFKAKESEKKGKGKADPFIRQLAWRDFYYQLYYQRPEILEKAFKKKFDHIFWENDQKKLKAWQEGRTGYPFIDAGMRQLLKEGFMHNRLRMAVASFLTKDLLIDWKKGEKHFMEHLKDGDLIVNNGGWQWAASTGADAQPYFRIFNPVTQSKKHDKNGQYIRQYIPELSELPDRFIHEPWKMNESDQKKYKVILGSDYPYPIVDHAEQRIKALEMYNI